MPARAAGGATLFVRRVVAERWDTILVATVSAVVGLVVVAPKPDSDPGVFNSVAAELGRGSRLYDEVWDHKDPLFYYLGWLGRWVLGSEGFYVVEGIALIAFGLGVLGMARALDVERGPAAVAALGALGLAVHPDVFFTGNSMLPGMAALVIALAAALQGRALAAGALMALAAGLRLPLVPFAVLPGVLVALRSGRRGLQRAALGSGVVAALVVAVIGVRGEASGYVDSIEMNLRYTELALESEGDRPVPLGTLGNAVDATMEAGFQASAAMLVLLSVTVAVLWRRACVVDRRALHAHAAGLVGLGSAALSVAFVGLTALWQQHLHPLALAAAGLLVAAAVLVQAPRPRMALVAVSAVVFSAPALGHLGDLDTFPERWTDRSSVDAELVVAIIDGAAPEATQISYAVVGVNTASSVVEFLPDRFDLACPYFFQYPWLGEERLAEHRRCVEAGVDVVIQHDAGVPSAAEADFDPWTRHLFETQEILLDGYVKVRTVEERGGDPYDLVVWREAPE